MLRMDEINKIRKAYNSDGKSINKIAVDLNRSWHTVKDAVQASRESLANRGLRPNREKSVLTKQVIDAVNAYLDKEELYKIKRKQRYSAELIFNELSQSKIYNGSSRALRGLVKEMRQKRGQNGPKSFLPLEFELGSVMQFDHGEVDCIVQGNRRIHYLFVASVPGAVLRFCQLYPNKAKEAWGDFHERAFAFFGGIPQKLVYDNDSVLIKSVIGNDHKQTKFSLGLDEHYGFASHFCNVRAGNEKGAVENAVGFCRRNFLAGCKEFVDFDEANSFLKTSCTQNIAKASHHKTKEPLAKLFEQVAAKLSPPMPSKMWRVWSPGRVSACQLITFDNHQYSVPERYCGAYLRIGVSAFKIDIFEQDELVASHHRLFEVGQDSLLLEHYLEQLERKPGALRDCKAFKEEDFPKQIYELWRRLKNRYEPRMANKELIGVLLLMRKYSYDEVLTAIELSLEHNAIECAAIDNIMRQLKEKIYYIDKDDLDTRLAHITVPSFDFDLSAYNSLAKEPCHAA